MIRSALTQVGYRVATAANGAEALTLFQARPERFDLVLTDIDMPLLNGAKLAMALAAIRPTLPIVAMSGLSLKSDEVDPEQFSGGFLSKPFRVDELLRAICQALKREAAGVLAGKNR